jgi:hypothetical protein
LARNATDINFCDAVGTDRQAGTVCAEQVDLLASAPSRVVLVTVASAGTG